jgi:hypothetical protein
MEGPLAKINNRDELEAWLRKQPREVAAALAARADLRGLPFGQKAKRKDYMREIALPVFRATAVSWAAARYPAHKTELAAADAAGAYAASGAARAAFAAFTPAAFAAAAAARAAADAFWSAVSLDASRVEVGATASIIAGSPLWPRGQPDRLQLMWRDMKAALHAEKQDWEVWTSWYDDRLVGRVRNEERELAYVRIEETLWKQGPAIVNAEIKRRIEADTVPDLRHPDIPGRVKCSCQRGQQSRCRRGGNRGISTAGV